MFTQPYTDSECRDATIPFQKIKVLTAFVLLTQTIVSSAELPVRGCDSLNIQGGSDHAVFRPLFGFVAVSLTGGASYPTGDMLYQGHNSQGFHAGAELIFPVGKHIWWSLAVERIHIQADEKCIHDLLENQTYFDLSVSHLTPFEATGLFTGPAAILRWSPITLYAALKPGLLLSRTISFYASDPQDPTDERDPYLYRRQISINITAFVLELQTAFMLGESPLYGIGASYVIGEASYDQIVRRGSLFGDIKARTSLFHIFLAVVF